MWTARQYCNGYSHFTAVLFDSSFQTFKQHLLRGLENFIQLVCKLIGV